MCTVVQRSVQPSPQRRRRQSYVISHSVTGLPEKLLRTKALCKIFQGFTWKAHQEHVFCGLAACGWHYWYLCLSVSICVSVHMSTAPPAPRRHLHNSWTALPRGRLSSKIFFSMAALEEPLPRQHSKVSLYLGIHPQAPTSKSLVLILSLTKAMSHIDLC